MFSTLYTSVMFDYLLTICGNSVTSYIENIAISAQSFRSYVYMCMCVYKCNLELQYVMSEMQSRTILVK